MEVDNEDSHKAITLILTKNVNKEWRDTKSIHETLKVVKKMLEERIKEDETVDIVDKHNKKMGIVENRSHRVRKQKGTKQVIIR